MGDNHEPTEPNGVPDPLLLTPLTRRSQQTPERPALPPEVEEQFNHLTLAVQMLSAHFLGESAPPSETLRERTARRVKKFQRANGEERASASGEESSPDAPSGNLTGGTATAEETTDPLAHNKNIAWPRQHVAGEGWTDGATVRRWWQRRPSMGLWLGAQAFGVLLLSIGYLLGRATASSPTHRGATTRPGHIAVDLFGQPELTEQGVQVANEGLHAEHTGNQDAARKTYETALNKHINLPGINYRLALLAVQRNDRLEAEQRLERSMLDGEDVAECSYVLARLAADKGDFEEVSNQLERATRARPLDGKYFFYWGEALRRQGKPQAAVTAFEQALDRPYAAENGDLYLFKLRLAKVEYGHDDAFNAELASQLKLLPVGGEWMLLAAAQSLDHRAYAVAAVQLRQAADRLPPSIYAALTHDYFFQSQGKQAEVTGLLNRTPPVFISSAGPTVLDPASWPPERADPATWPSASNSSAQ